MLLTYLYSLFDSNFNKHIQLLTYLGLLAKLACLRRLKGAWNRNDDGG